MADEPQERLRARLAAGEPEAFAEFYDRCAPGMLSLARAITRSHSDAEDCVQQTFLELFKARRGFARADSLRAEVRWQGDARKARFDSLDPLLKDKTPSIQLD